MQIGSLFSGIGGLELGLEWAGLGETIWQVEQDEKLQNCLKEHWPNAKRFSDVREVGKHNLEPVDLICGGFPCQDVSAAGKGAGLSGSRSGLWFEFARIVGELHPRWVVVENVASGAQRWVDAVRKELEQLGYTSLPIPLSAADCGAWHRRSRVFIVAHADNSRSWTERKAGRGERSNGKESAITQELTANADGLRELQPEGIKQDKRRRTSNCCRQWASEPDVARMVYGLPNRAHRERALGNCVVPQCAHVIGEVIKILEAR